MGTCIRSSQQRVQAHYTRQEEKLSDQLAYNETVRASSPLLMMKNTLMKMNVSGNTAY
jgi:hypothetical protein